MWGTIKCARYKKEEMFYDELHCHYGVEFQGWLLNNTEHCFSYDKSTRIITYHVEVKYMWSLNQVSMIMIHLIK